MFFHECMPAQQNLAFGGEALAFAFGDLAAFAERSGR